jgi:hypothetical protein
MRLIAAFVGITALQHGAQATLGLRGAGDPRLLVTEHVVVCLTGLAAAWAVWRGDRWAPWILGLNGASTAVLVVSLGPLLAMDAVARNGLWSGGLFIALLTVAGVWYARRRVTSVPQHDDAYARSRVGESGV